MSDTKQEMAKQQKKVQKPIQSSASGLFPDEFD